MRAAHDQPYWCEENAWHLCADARLAGLRVEVAIITNAARSVALWHQRAAPDPDAPVVWDYHVMLFAQGDRGWSAWDLDTTLAFPDPATHWLDATFRLCASRLAPRFRILAAADYRSTFASDRRHMRDANGGWQQPPPAWATIGDGHNLPDLLDLERGTWLALGDLRTRLC